ncbi:NTn (N-terminal nucleophile) hydrolase [Cotonvirus japonicus]|uniref:NTn (N-terminal nucleophile) hydrolase n=1 Tax=Cotonvirus japonicus TaxID=2811091 RepID=A0ABM7NTK0_9VIRU|nr:NTn (N-terminal nucleophile) hydrolase [Cotonvirus japonicus]BCS83459.1 NTn (N-terminal nucleophile) hydrolase [Cotonvirus japonicus]
MQEIPYYDFDLDLPPEERWEKIIDEYCDVMAETKIHITKILANFSFGLNIVRLASGLINESNSLHYKEIIYIAKRLNMATHEVLLLQLLYETSSACTTAIIKTNKLEFFFRTMDWPMDFLKDITIGLKIISNNRIIGTAVTWVGYVGFLTATNIEHKYSIAINYRRVNDMTVNTIINNVYRTISLKWPIGYLVRNIIENNYNRKTCKDKLINTELISPCYITMFNPKNKSLIITRDCNQVVDVRFDNLFQANCDCGKTEPNILHSIERVNHVKAIINKIQENPDKIVDVNKLIKTITKYPVVNEETIYVHYQYDDNIYTGIVN